MCEESFCTPSGGTRGGVTSVAYAPGGGEIASGSNDKTVRIWSVRGELLQTLRGHEDWVTGVAYAPGGLLATAGSGGEVQLWKKDSEANGGQYRLQWSTPHALTCVGANCWDAVLGDSLRALLRDKDAEF